MDCPQALGCCSIRSSTYKGMGDGDIAFAALRHHPLSSPKNNTNSVVTPDLIRGRNRERDCDRELDLPE